MKHNSIRRKMRGTVIVAAFTLLFNSCGTMGTGTGGVDLLGGILGAATDGNTITNVITSVLGADKPSEASLMATWRYSGPGCAFTSENLLAKAGGEVVATDIKGKLQTYYQQIGINQQNTYITFS